MTQKSIKKSNDPDYSEYLNKVKCSVETVKVKETVVIANDNSPISEVGIGIRYIPIPEDTKLKFYEFKGITSVITQIKDSGYLVSIDDEKRVFEYILSNPDTHKKDYVIKLIYSLNLSLDATKFVKPNYQSFKKDIEYTPSSPQIQDIVEGFIKKDYWEKTDNDIRFDRRKNNSENEIGILKIKSEHHNLVNRLDCTDIKILIAIMGEAYYKPRKFYVSCREIAEKIGYLNNRVIVNNKGLNLNEKLRDIQYRIEHKLCSIYYDWNNVKGDSPYYSSEELGKLLSIGMTLMNRYKYLIFEKDIYIEIELNDWFHYNKEILKQHTRIPTQLLTFNVNPNKYKRAFLIAYKISIHFRINKKNLISEDIKELTVTVKTIINYLFNHSEIESALKDAKKGFTLKNKLLTDFKYLNKILGWKIVTDIDSYKNFKDVYSKGTVKIILNTELEQALFDKPSDITTPKVNKVKLITYGCYNIFPEDLKSLRKVLKMSQVEFARKLGISQGTISKIENNTHPINKDIYTKLIFYFKDELKLIKK